MRASGGTASLKPAIHTQAPRRCGVKAALLHLAGATKLQHGKCTTRHYCMCCMSVYVVGGVVADADTGFVGGRGRRLRLTAQYDLTLVSTVLSVHDPRSERARHTSRDVHIITVSAISYVAAHAAGVTARV